MDWTPVLESLQSAVVTILIALISAASAFAIAYLNKLMNKVKAETSKINDDATEKLINDALNRVSGLVDTVVKSIEQESVKGLKEAIADGKVDRSELVSLKNIAVKNVLALISNETLELLNKQIPDIEDYISNLVSKSVLELRLTQASINNSSESTIVPKE